MNSSSRTQQTATRHALGRQSRHHTTSGKRTKPAYLKELVDDAVQKGATILNEGGGAMRDRISIPAVLYPVSSDMRVWEENSSDRSFHCAFPFRRVNRWSILTSPTTGSRSASSAKTRTGWWNSSIRWSTSCVVSISTASVSGDRMSILQRKKDSAWPP